MLTLIDDADERRRILGQINRHECRHTLARVVFHAKRGELRQRYREGQEDQLGALGLVVNMIVLWNTIYMDAALTGSGRRASSSATRTWHASTRSASPTSTCSGDTPSFCPRPRPRRAAGAARTKLHRRQLR